MIRVEQFEYFEVIKRNGPPASLSLIRVKNSLFHQ